MQVSLSASYLLCNITQVFLKNLRKLTYKIRVVRVTYLVNLNFPLKIKAEIKVGEVI